MHVTQGYMHGIRKVLCLNPGYTQSFMLRSMLREVLCTLYARFYALIHSIRKVLCFDPRYGRFYARYTQGFML